MLGIFSVLRLTVLGFSTELPGESRLAYLFDDRPGFYRDLRIVFPESIQSRNLFKSTLNPSDRKQIEKTISTFNMFQCFSEK